MNLANRLPEYKNNAPSPSDTLRLGAGINTLTTEDQSLESLAGQYGQNDFYQQQGVLRQLDADKTAVHTVEQEEPMPRQEDAGLSIFSDLYIPQEPLDLNEAPKRKRLWTRLGGRAAKEAVRTSGVDTSHDAQADNVQVIAAATIEALDKMQVSRTRPSVVERVRGLIGSLKLKAGVLSTGGNGNFTKFLEKHPKATVAVGVVAVAGLVASAYFRIRGIDLMGGQAQAADVVQPGSGIGSGVQVHEASAVKGSGGSSLHHQAVQTPGSESYIPIEDAPDSDGDRSFIPRDSGPETVSTEQLSGPGDTISHHAERRLIEKGIPDPNWDQIRVETQRILDLNGLSWEDARHMGTDVKFKVS